MLYTINEVDNREEQNFAFLAHVHVIKETMSHTAMGYTTHVITNGNVCNKVQQSFVFLEIVEGSYIRCC